MVAVYASETSTAVHHCRLYAPSADKDPLMRTSPPHRRVSSRRPGPCSVTGSLLGNCGVFTLHSRSDGRLKPPPAAPHGRSSRDAGWHTQLSRRTGCPGCDQTRIVAILLISIIIILCYPRANVTQEEVRDPWTVSCCRTSLPSRRSDGPQNPSHRFTFSELQPDLAAIKKKRWTPELWAVSGPHGYSEVEDPWTKPSLWPPPTSTDTLSE